jgi:Ca2+-binding RTX toxin-like protein
MSTIENRLIHLGNIPGTDVPYYHRYTIYTKDNGEQWVLRSGPSENDYRPNISDAFNDIVGSGSQNFGTIKFVYEKYRNADGSIPSYTLLSNVVYPADTISYSNNSNYDQRLHLTTGTIITGTDAELDLVISQMVSRGQEINSLKIPYSASHQNSNTADKYVWGNLDIDYDGLAYEPIEGTGHGAISNVLRQQIEFSGGILEGKNAWAPATDEDFEQHVNTATVAWDLIENSAEWLYEHTGKPLIDFISESGKTVYDWASEVADKIGTTSADLFNGAKDFFSDLFGLEDSNVTAYNGDATIQFANSGLIGTDAVYVDSQGNPTSVYDSFFKAADSEGKETTFIREGTNVKTKDGTFVSVDSVIKTVESEKTYIQSFLLGSADFGKDLLSAVGSIFDNTRSQLHDQNNNLLYLDQDGNQTTESYHYLTDEEGNAVLDEEGNQVREENEKATDPSNMDLLLADFAARVATGSDFDEAAVESAKVAIARSVSRDLVEKIGINDTQVQNGVAVAIARIGIIHLNGDDPNSQDYAMAAMEGILLAAGIPPGVVSGIIAATNKIIEEDGKFNSDGYQDVVTIAVTTAVVATVCIAIGQAIGTAIGGPVGFVVGTVVGALVGYLIAVPLYNAVRDGWEDSEQIYDAFEDIFKGDNIEDQLKEALKGYEDYVKDITIDLIRDVGRGAITLFTGRYGKELKDGQYWNPLPSLRIIPKEDGTGNIIQGLDPQGVVAIAREYYHDDIYGTSGSDSLVGKSGTNTIVGYEGNDHIEGRGDVDLLVGGKGDDEIFGGNGDDQIYGSEGADNLFGGNGNDIIIGGTGASIGGNGSLEDGNDFIQGGNGDDQIMGEAGNDIIQGDAGNDVILGGTGNDRIEGNEGDDSILGEDGDDMILGGAGSDIIDGGAGVDYIEGGEGNDEISGNSGVDIIYGDAGNDLINTGSENDLALGNYIIYGADGEILKKTEFTDGKVIANDNFLIEQKFQKTKKIKI